MVVVNECLRPCHAVVVNWNSQLIPLLKQMAVAKAERAGTFERPVVLLASRGFNYSTHPSPPHAYGYICICHASPSFRHCFQKSPLARPTD